MRDTKTLIGLYIGALILLSTSPAPSALAEPSGPVESPADMAVLELLRAEVLDTVSLDRPVHFTTPQATDTVAQAGTYRVQAGEPSQMKLLALKHSTAMVLDALSITHETDIAEPIALYVRDDDEFPHVVLLLPGGRVSKRSATTMAAARVGFEYCNSLRSRFRTRCRRRWRSSASSTDRVEY